MHLMLRTILSVWVVVIAAGMFRGCSSLPTPTPASNAGSHEAATLEAFPEGTRVITIVHSNDVRGEVDPCG